MWQQLLVLYLMVVRCLHQFPHCSELKKNQVIFHILMWKVVHMLTSLFRTLLLTLSEEVCSILVSRVFLFSKILMLIKYLNPLHLMSQKIKNINSSTPFFQYVNLTSFWKLLHFSVKTISTVIVKCRSWIRYKKLRGINYFAFKFKSAFTVFM